MNQQPVIIKTVMTLEDFCTVRKQVGKAQRIALPILLPLMMILLLSYTIPFSIYENLLLISLLYVASVAIFAVLLDLLWKRNWKAEYNSNKALQYEQVFELNKEGLKTSSQKGSFFYAWDDLYAYQENKEGFFIFVSNTQYCYIPKRIFEDGEAQVEAARRYIQRLPAYRKVRKAGIYGAKVALAFLLFFAALILAIVCVAHFVFKTPLSEFIPWL